MAWEKKYEIKDEFVAKIAQALDGEFNARATQYNDEIDGTASAFGEILEIIESDWPPSQKLTGIERVAQGWLYS